MSITTTTAPGVYVKDERPLLRPYESASISDLAMISQITLQDSSAAPPTNPITLSSFDDFVRHLGGDALLLRCIRDGIEWDSTGPYINERAINKFAEKLSAHIVLIEKLTQPQQLKNQLPALAEVRLVPRFSQAKAASDTQSGIAREIETIFVKKEKLKPSDNKTITQADVKEYVNSLKALLVALESEESKKPLTAPLLTEKTGGEGGGDSDPTLDSATVPAATKKGDTKSEAKTSSKSDSLSDLSRQLGQIAVTAWSVWGYFQNGGRRPKISHENCS